MGKRAQGGLDKRPVVMTNEPARSAGLPAQICSRCFIAYIAWLILISKDKKVCDNSSMQCAHCNLDDYAFIQKQASVVVQFFQI